MYSRLKAILYSRLSRDRQGVVRDRANLPSSRYFIAFAFLWNPSA